MAVPERVNSSDPNGPQNEAVSSSAFPPGWSPVPTCQLCGVVGNTAPGCPLNGNIAGPANKQNQPNGKGKGKNRTQYQNNYNYGKGYNVNDNFYSQNHGTGGAQGSAADQNLPAQFAPAGYGGHGYGYLGNDGYWH